MGLYLSTFSHQHLNDLDVTTVGCNQKGRSSMLQYAHVHTHHCVSLWGHGLFVNIFVLKRAKPRAENINVTGNQQLYIKESRVYFHHTNNSVKMKTVDNFPLVWLTIQMFKNDRCMVCTEIGTILKRSREKDGGHRQRESECEIGTRTFCECVHVLMKAANHQLPALCFAPSHMLSLSLSLCVLYNLSLTIVFWFLLSASVSILVHTLDFLFLFSSRLPWVWHHHITYITPTSQMSTNRVFSLATTKLKDFSDAPNACSHIFGRVTESALGNYIEIAQESNCLYYDWIVEW